MNATPEKYTCANTIAEEKKKTTSFPLAELKSVYLRLPSKKASDETFNPRTIANRIGKDKSVVSRETRRNADKRNGHTKHLWHNVHTERMASKPKAYKFTDEIKRLWTSYLRTTIAQSRSTDAVN